MDPSYYSRRIDDLEKRKNKIISRIYADKLSLKAINEELEKCDAAMQKLGEPAQKEFMVLQKEIKDLRNDLLEKDKEIETLKRNFDKKESKIERLEVNIAKLKKRRNKLADENKKLKQDLTHANKTINNLEQKLLMENVPDEEVILSKNFGKENIFDELRK